MITPRAAVSAIKRIVKDNAAETTYTSYGLPADWGGFATNTDPMIGTQSAVITDLFDVTLADNTTNIAAKQGLEVNVRRLDLHFDFLFQAQQGNSELYGNPGRYPPPFIICEYWICQMNSNAVTSIIAEEKVPDSAEFSDAMWYDRTWAGRKLRPEFFDPRLEGAKDVRKRWKVLHYKVIRVKPHYMNSRVPTGTKTAVITAGIPAGLIDAASAVQPWNHIIDSSESLDASRVKMYKSLSMYKARPIKFDATAGARANQVQGRLFMASRWWHPTGYDHERALAIPAGLTSIDHFKDVTVSVHHRMTYKP